MPLGDWGVTDGYHAAAAAHQQVATPVQAAVPPCRYGIIAAPFHPQDS